MLGAIAGDIIGSIYEHNNIKSVDFALFSPGCTFTDDTVLTVAVADRILNGGNYVEKFRQYYSLYPSAGYGAAFHAWASAREPVPYNSWGNGSAMRVSPVGFAYDTLAEVLAEARNSAAVTHNHPEGIKGAQAVASSIFLARRGEGKENIRNFVASSFGYDLTLPIDAIRESYTFDISCQGSVPQAISSFLESEDFEDAVRKAVSIGGDSDTIACIAGGIAQAYYQGVPEWIAERVYDILDARLGSVTGEFMERFG